MEHRLRRYSNLSITDDELNEVENLIDFDKYSDSDEYEFNGGFLFTKNYGDIEEAHDHMCCGIITEEAELSNGDVVYFTFDYGH